MNYPENDYRNYLYHHGIKGQKWGVRRFQNKDGTLTELGKRRYYNEHREEIKSILSTASNEFNRSEASKNLSDDVNKAYKILDKHISDTSKLEDKMFDALTKYGNKSKQYLDARAKVKENEKTEAAIHKTYRDAIKKLDDSYRNYSISKLDSTINDTDLSNFLYNEYQKDRYFIKR